MKIFQTAFTLSFELPPIALPMSSRAWEPEDEVTAPHPPEEPDEVIAVLAHMLMGECNSWLPRELRLLGTDACTLDPYQRLTDGLVGDVTFCPRSPEFRDAYGYHVDDAKQALSFLLEKFQSMCETPGALTWATNRVRRDAECKRIRDIGYECGAIHERIMAVYAAYVELPPPEFAGNRVLPARVYKP